jgi:hypothetical protein
MIVFRRYGEPVAVRPRTCFQFQVVRGLACRVAGISRDRVFINCGATLRVAIHDAERRATLVAASPR